MRRIELEVLPGLEALAANEAGGLTLPADEVTRALGLRLPVAAHLARDHPVPRPKGLLGEEHLRNLLADIDAARAVSTFTGFRFDAAGRDSTVFGRLAGELVGRTGLPHDPDDGDLVIRVRKGGAGWETLVRLTPRPLSTRSWRVRDHPAALNATIAAAMVRLAAPSPRDRILNLLCGSGSLLAEAGRGIGIDRDTGALAMARANVARTTASLVHGDAAREPLRASAFDVLLADLPYGHRSGSHEENEQLHPRLLAAAARLAAPGARFVVITHELRRFDAALRAQSQWRVARQLQVFQKGHHPKIWVLTAGR